MTPSFLELVVAHASLWLDGHAGMCQVAMHRDDFVKFTCLSGLPVTQKLSLDVGGQTVTVVPHALAREGNLYVGHEGAIRRGAAFPPQRP